MPTRDSEVDFDRDAIAEREHRYSLKWDCAERLGHSPEELPLWVADMDFPVAPGIQRALSDFASEGFMGYSEPGESYVDSVTGWFLRRHRVTYEPEWLVRTPGVVFALSNAVASLTEPGDAVMILSPVYYPFASSVRANRRRLVECELAYDPAANPAYSMDYAAIERAMDAEDVRMLIVCSPHNPVGRVWTACELQALGDICASRDVIVISDEIHCDLTLFGNVFTPFLKACPDLAERCVVCTAPSKSFSIAGLQCSNIWIPSEDLRGRFSNRLSMLGVSPPNILGQVACMAAYDECGDWLDAAIAYIESNMLHMREFIEREIPGVSMVFPQGTYLAWLDMTALGIKPKELDSFMRTEAGLWLDAGTMFGKGGEGFQRLNAACTRQTLDEALRRLCSAVLDL